MRAPNWYADQDGDEYGDIATKVQACDPPSGHVENSNDCDDMEPLAYTGAEEACDDGVDNNCDGYVDQMVAGSTHTRIQKAIKAACSAGDTVWVVPGVYPENIKFKGYNIRLRSTDGAAATTIDGSACTHDTKCATVRFEENTNKAMIDGFTVTGGVANSHQKTEWVVGGGIQIYKSTVTVENCIVEENRATYGGGIGIWTGGTPVIQNNVIRDNESLEGAGGGVAIWRDGTGTTTVLNNEISENRAELGGGVFIKSSPEFTLKGNYIARNEAKYFGGGLHFYTWGNWIDNVVEENTAGTGGGGIFAIQATKRTSVLEM